MARLRRSRRKAKRAGVRAPAEMVAALQAALGSTDPATLRGLAEYYCYLGKAQRVWDDLDAALARLETDLRTVLDAERFAFRRWSLNKPQVPGLEPDETLKAPAKVLLDAVRVERSARAAALAEAQSAADHHNPALTRAEADLPFIGKPAAATYFAFTAAGEWFLNPVHMAMIESLVAQGYFEGLEPPSRAVGLYGTDAKSSKAATDRWRNALTSLGFTARGLEAARGPDVQAE